jgi:hypothetical protein
MIALSGAAKYRNLDLFKWLLYKEAITSIYDNKNDMLCFTTSEGYTKVV